MRTVLLTLILTCCMIVSLSLNACTDAKRAEMFRFGDSAEITATAFGTELYKGVSTGKLQKKEGGYLFVEKSTGDTIQILGSSVDFVIRYKN